MDEKLSAWLERVSSPPADTQDYVEFVELLIECHGRLDTSTALRVADAIAPYNPMWFEEPVPPIMPPNTGSPSAPVPITTAMVRNALRVWKRRRILPISMPSSVRWTSAVSSCFAMSFK